VNEQFTIYLGSASPTGITVYVNATCETCSSPLSGLNVMGVTEGSANTLTTSLANTDFLNVTLYSNVTGATGGITSRTIYIKSTAV
jgi:hypothetical protein